MRRLFGACEYVNYHTSQRVSIFLDGGQNILQPAIRVGRRCHLGACLVMSVENAFFA